ncbi:MAG: hypothetical protein OEX12_05175, partial [Gammaproteobacteria bacterium]|nr:hypothetical protein [Gammaproteobacteria bacterium]
MATEDPSDILMLTFLRIVSSPSGAATVFDKLMVSIMVCIGMLNKVWFRSGYSKLALTTMLILGLVLHSKVWAEQEKSIVIIGDSLSAAHGIPVETSWPQLLQNKMHENHLPYRVINTSISGDTSY